MGILFACLGKTGQKREKANIVRQRHFLASTVRLSIRKKE